MDYKNKYVTLRIKVSSSQLFYTKMCLSVHFFIWNEGKTFRSTLISFFLFFFFLNNKREEDLEGNWRKKAGNNAEEDDLTLLEFDFRAGGSIFRRIPISSLSSRFVPRQSFPKSPKKSWPDSIPLISFPHAVTINFVIGNVQKLFEQLPNYRLTCGNQQPDYFTNSFARAKKILRKFDSLIDDSVE